MPPKKSFSKVSDPKDESFLIELKRIPATLKIEDSASFFRHILSLFKKNPIQNDIGNEILLTICKLLTIKDHRKVFVSNNFVKSLPYDNFLLVDNILNILDLVITSRTASKQILTPFILEPISKRSPYKTLILLGKYLQNTNVEDIYVGRKNRRSGNKKGNKNQDVDDSEAYEWIDLLLYTDSFKKPVCAQNYMSLLLYFLENNEDFAYDYSKKIWEIICGLLQSQNDNIIKYAYQSLCFLIDSQICTFSTIPFDLIANHLTKISLQKMAMSFLFRCKLTKLESPELIKILIHLALTKKKAFIILQRIAETENGAYLLIENSTWMGKSLPDKLSTVSLFCGVLMHNELRETLSSKTKDVVNLLITAFSFENDINSQQEPKKKRGSNNHDDDDHQEESSIIISIICTILRRITVTKELVKQMSRTNFLGAYLSKATKQNKNAFYALHVIKIVGECCYTNDLLNVIDFLVTSIKKNDDNSNFALDTSSCLCKYRTCAEKFREKKIDDYLLNLSKNTKYQKRFLRALGVIE